MGLFDGMQVEVSTEQVEQQEEFVQGTANKIEKSGVYPMIIKMATLGASPRKEPDNYGKSGGSVFFKLELETEDGKRVTATEYMTSSYKVTNGVEAVPKNTYFKDGKTYDMPGYAKIKNLNYLLNGVHGEPSQVEEKEIKEYDFDAKADVAVRRQVIMDFVGKPIDVCVKVLQKDDYRDSTKAVERREAAHFCDPITGQFGSEKLTGKPAALKEKFVAGIPEEGVYDERKNSKGGAPAGTASTGTSTGAASSF